MNQLNATHDPALKSWVVSANQPDTDFPIQNLPYAVFASKDAAHDFRVGVGIGDQILDLRALASLAPFKGEAAQALSACKYNNLNALMALNTSLWSALRSELSQSLARGSSRKELLQQLLLPQSDAIYGLPAQIGDYTDFYISLHHASAVGKQFRPDNPLLPNYKWVPIGYHGRASSINVSGHSFTRPMGQMRPEAEGAEPRVGPCERLDYELELGIFIGNGNPQGRRIPIEDAESHIFGLCLLNDWSARDIQAWEYQPLGPFLAKNFASTISPWVISYEALLPFRIPYERSPSDPQPLPYLSSETASALDIKLEVWLSTEQSRARGLEPAYLASSNFKDAYWNIAQLISHHTINGCNLRAGDLLGTGTLSGPESGQEGSLLEMTKGGNQALHLPWGEERRFLEDGDEVIFKASCQKDHYPRIGFGKCRATVMPT
ncbi:fumarylacetoacetase [Paenalcaligenes niemegkensis]|uniref:fumarylacetoacetase n=1 Tax=Paenalcaligenes niemegkensis TaxID=2895469 RepID=UPI001EE953EC|nr:fumarylacetoacetase [Paenalcaligenes niemegkensis]MCQ9617241.1 fumarylacetoacetase [Paenalcaligenes niemegkensis]